MHTQQDVIFCPELMVQPCLNPRLPINNNHMTSICAAGVARGSRSILPLPPLTVLRPIIHLQNRSKLTDKQMDKVRRIVHPKLKPLNFQLLIQKLNYLKKTYNLYDANYPLDNPCQTYNPSLVRERPMTVLLTGLSRVFVPEFFKGTSGC